MNRLFSLDERLQKCASLVPHGARLVDVGTDHAYLPVWLLKNGRISYAIASDINEKPLESGRLTAEKYDADNIDFRLGSGLATVSEGDCLDCAVIAGMGGEIIAEILSGSALSKQLTLVLQPMTKSEELILYLCENCYEISEQVCAESRGKYYTIIKAKFSGKAADYDDTYPYTGELDLTDAVCERFIRNHIKHLSNKSKGDKTLIPLIKKLEDIINEN